MRASETVRPGRWALCAAIVFALGHQVAAVEFLRADALRPGMRGKGHTVFSGTRIEEFDVEVLGVLKDAFGPKQDLVLARADAPALKDGPIAAGMSGSPVYVEGKLIGAIAITWIFAKGGYCGITPIHEMVEDAQTTEAPPARAAALPGRAPTPVLARLMGPGAPTPPDFPGVPSADLRPIPVPVVASAASPRLRQVLDPLLRARGLMMLPAGGAAAGGAGPEEAPAALRPGAAVGVRLIEGDLDYTAVGTVTHVEGDRVLAFGHPLFDGGDFSAPLTSARVLATVPSYYYPMKMASGGATLGAFERDRRTVVAGRLGDRPDMVPCTVTIRDGRNQREHRFEYRIVRHRDLTPYFAGIGLVAAFDRAAASGGDFMAETALTVRMAGRDAPLVLTDRFFGSDGEIFWRLFGMAFELGALRENPFEAVQFEAIEASVDLLPGRQTARIHSIGVDRRRVKPGGTVEATVRLKPYRDQGFVEKTVRIIVPPDVPPGTALTVQACDASRAESLKRSSAPGLYAPENLDQLLALVKQLERSDHLIVYVALPRTGVSRMGRALPDLPASLVRVMGATNETGIGPVGDALIERLPTPWVLEGGDAITIYVVKEE